MYLYYYTVCHFGARYSALCWSRVGAFLLRLIRLFLHHSHASWSYVGNFLIAIHKSWGTAGILLCLAFFEILGVPLSWAKLQIGKHIRWLGLDLLWPMAVSPQRFVA